MSNHSFQQPLNEGNSQPPKHPSDFLNEFRDWWIKVPFMSKLIFYFSLSIYMLSWINKTFPWSLTNIPYFTIFHFEIYRILISPFIHVKLAELIFGFFLFLPMAQEKEREMGSIAFIIDFFLKNFLVELAFLSFMSLLGFASVYFLEKDSYGVLNYYFVYLAIRCAEKPDDPTMILCLPIQIKAKWYPIVLVLLFNIMFFIKFDFIFAVLIGLMDYKFLAKYITISKEKYISIEGSEYFSVLQLSSDFISVKNVFQPFAQNSEILANKDDFGGKGVIIGKNEQEIYEDNEKNPSVENLNEENSKNYGSSNTNKAESQQQNQPRNDRFLEFNEDG